MTKKRILALGILVAVISVTGIIVYNSNRNEADTVGTIAHIETDEATTPTPPPPVEDKKVEDDTPVKEDNESIETEDTTAVDNTTALEDTTPVDNTPPVEDTVESDITPLDQIMYAQGDVNTRSGPSTDYEKVGGLSVNQEVHITGQSRLTGWYEIEVDGEKQYVSSDGLSSTPITPTTTDDTTAQSAQGDSTIDNSYNELSPAEQDAVDDIVEEIMAEHPEWFTDTPSTGNYEHVGTPDTGEFTNPDYEFGQGDYSEGAGGIIY